MSNFNHSAYKVLTVLISISAKLFSVQKENLSKKELLMNRKLTLGVLCGLLGMLTHAEAQTSRPTSRPSSRPTKRQLRAAKKIVGAKPAEQNSTRLLKDIIWYSSMDEAKAQAKRQKKLIFWMHSVGNLPGKI